MTKGTTAMALMVLLSASATALAYRPFDSTDAAVADAGEFELEFGPLGRLHEGSRKVNVAPAVIANVGFAGDRELVLQSQREVALTRDGGEPRSSLQNNGAFIKQVLRRGVLQDETGPSVATEYGLLLPAVPGHGTGASIAGIVSQRWEYATAHLNAAAARTRDHEPDIFVGAILEGPSRWPARPVAEIFTEKTGGAARTRSWLVGAIWRAGDGLAFDVGARRAHSGQDSVQELRLGFTWVFSYR